jgi:hypothetical protein
MGLRLPAAVNTAFVTTIPLFLIFILLFLLVLVLLITSIAALANARASSVVG